MIKSADELFARLDKLGIRMSVQEREAIVKCSDVYKMSISDYYFHLIDWNDASCTTG